MVSNILFLNRNFYSYDQEIKKRLEEQNHQVFSYSILPNLNFSQKIKMHFGKKNIINEIAKIQQERILEELKEKNISIDIIFVLAGQDLQEQTIVQLKEMYKNAKFIWYIWDNINKLKEYNNNSKFFDKIISFDKKDAEIYKLDFLPLFFIKETKCDKKYNLCFIGADHSIRKDVIRQFLKLYKEKNNFIYILSNRYLIIKAIFNRKYRNLIPFMKLKIIDTNKVAEIIASSKVILDIPTPEQTGLTMRTIETMGAHCKLVTTNKEVQKYDFYNEKNIYILDINNIKIPEESFFKTPYMELDEKILSNYSINSWIKKINNYFC